MPGQIGEDDIGWTSANSGGGGSGTVTSVGLTTPANSFFTVSGSPVTTSGSITITPVAAKGDLPYASAVNTISNLAIGTTGEVLTVSAGGLPSWAAASASGSIPGFIQWEFPIIAVSPTTDATNWQILQAAGTFTRVDVIAKTAPTGANLIVDILLSANNGTTFTSLWAVNPGNKPTLVAGTKNGSTVAFDTTTFSQSNILRIDIDQVGSTVPGGYLTVQLR